MNLFTKQKQTDSENKLMVTRGEELWGGIVREFGIDKKKKVVYLYIVHL